MDCLLEAIFEPIAEGVVEFLCGGFRSIGEEGWTESKCRVQTLFGNDIWWNAPPE
jgi:hypothetical protein